MNSEHLATHHDHEHKADCGHTTVRHGDHVDYLHDGHLHHPTGQGDVVKEHALEVSTSNLAACLHGENNGGHDASHQHGPDCGHEAVPHGDHTDY